MTGFPEGSARIAIVTPYYRPVVGGISTFVESLVHGLRSRGHEVRVWTRYGGPGDAVSAGPEDKRAFASRVRKELASWAPDVVHAHSHRYALTAGYRLGSPIATRTVFTLHTDWAPPEGWVRERNLSRWLRRADVVTCVSAKRLSAVRARFPRIRNAVLVHPGVRVLNSTADARRSVIESLDLHASFPTLAVLSMMVWHDKVRGLELLVRSLPRILGSCPAATLVFVGDGPLRSGLEAAADAAGVRARVRFAGVQTDPGPFVAASDLALHCSYQDSFPQSVLECVSLGKPVVVNAEVADAFPGNPRELGLWPVPPDEESIAAAVTQLANDETLRRRMGEDGRRKVESEFDWRRTVDRFLDLYRG